MAHLGCKFLGHHVSALLVCAGEGDVDRGRSAKIQNLRDDVRGAKEKLRAGLLLRKEVAQLVDVLGGTFAAFLLELYQDFGVGSADGSGVAVAEVNSAVRQADVVQDGYQFVLRNDLSNGLVDLIREASGFLAAQAGAGAHAEPGLAGVHVGENSARRKSTPPCEEE